MKKTALIAGAIGAALVIPIVLWVIFAVVVFSEENYYPEKNSFAYFMGLSSFIRGAPDDGCLDKATFFGTAGDGNKPASSELSCIIPPGKEELFWAKYVRYIEKQNASSRDEVAANLYVGFYVPGAEVVKAKKLLIDSHDEGYLILLGDAAKKSFWIKLVHYD
ncbi:hypothetical protein [Eleftheria terrae]|uniref:hypothetical protein n=1 Tax=Eleftheria terrae TaxID=1597781 RepID=UPI00263B70ED|nr:hypothetical protein [Eleftheria terrae]WKB54408.1 hypothetical protein N7L95_08490 [Eleftheria terrae]